MKNNNKIIAKNNKSNGFSIRPKRCHICQKMFNPEKYVFYKFILGLAFHDVLPFLKGKGLQLNIINKKIEDKDKKHPDAGNHK
jgi:hypothetical protein